MRHIAPRTNCARDFLSSLQRGRVRKGTRQQPVLEVLEPRQLLSSSGPFSFDFGTVSSPLAAGYTKVTASTSYSSSSGFGWLSGSIQDRDRGTPAVPLRDLNFTTNGTFAVDTVNGLYNITLSSGDASFAHDDEGVYIEGNLVDTITTAAGQFVTHTYQVAVTDGQMDITMKDLGGSDPNCVINALVITPQALLKASAGNNFSTNEGQSVTFAGTASGGVAPYTYQWNFGDGGTASGSLTPTYTYSTYGSYTATLSVMDSTGASAQASLVATINDVAPTVSIGGPYQGTAQSAVGFAASATEPNAAEQASLAYSWNFGDGTTATGADPSHAFAAAGIYGVTLTVTNPGGLSSQATTSVSISPAFRGALLL